MLVSERPEGLSGLLVGEKDRSELVGRISTICLLMFMNFDVLWSEGGRPSDIIVVRCAQIYSRCVCIMFKLFPQL